MSILTSIGQGDQWFDNQLKRFGIYPENIVWREDGSIDYTGDIRVEDTDKSIDWSKTLSLRFNNILGSVVFSHCDFEKIPFVFNRVVYGFACFYCDNLKTLENSPKKVGGTFQCSMCKQLISLEGAPRWVGENFAIYRCYNLCSLQGAPRYVDGTFNTCMCGTSFTDEEILKVSQVGSIDHY